MRVIGLMSGTSADGVDAALVEWPEGESERPLRLRAFRQDPFPPALQRRAARTAAQAQRRVVSRARARTGGSGSIIRAFPGAGWRASLEPAPASAPAVSGGVVPGRAMPQQAAELAQHRQVGASSDLAARPVHAAHRHLDHGDAPAPGQEEHLEVEAEAPQALVREESPRDVRALRRKLRHTASAVRSAQRIFVGDLVADAAGPDTSAIDARKAALVKAKEAAETASRCRFQSAVALIVPMRSPSNVKSGTRTVPATAGFSSAPTSATSTSAVPLMRSNTGLAKARRGSST